MMAKHETIEQMQEREREILARLVTASGNRPKPLPMPSSGQLLYPNLQGSFDQGWGYRARFGLLCGVLSSAATAFAIAYLRHAPLVECVLLAIIIPGFLVSVGALGRVAFHVTRDWLEGGRAVDRRRRGEP